MKKSQACRLLFSLCGLLLMASPAFSQKHGKNVEVYPMPVDENSGKITYQQVVPMPETPADSLFDRAVVWANSYFQNPTKVIQTADKGNGVLICRSSLKIHTPTKDGKTEMMAGVVHYTLRIEAKSGRYRYTLTEFACKNGAVTQDCDQWLDKGKPEWTPVRNGHLKEIDDHCRALVQSLEKGMQAKKALHDDW